MSANDCLEIVRDYYAGCSRGDRARMIATFTPDVVHYFPTNDPIRGAEALADHWVRVQGRTGAVWTVDHGIQQGDEAVIEWSMTFADPKSGDRGRLRGAEWYVFRDGKIAEIRAYYQPGQRISELRGYPYAERGYPTVEAAGA